METLLECEVQGRCLRLQIILKSKTMLELFIELTNQLYWEDYAQQLANDNPAGFQFEFNEFVNSYNL
jgi:hypothetical protein